jgi:hypothetical protein
MSSNDDDPNVSGKSDRDRRDRIRNRHNQAAKDGRHLPSLSELLAGGSFMGADIFVDAKTWAERVMSRVDRATTPGPLVHDALAALTCDPRMADFEATATALRHADNRLNFIDVDSTPEEVKLSVYRGPDLEPCAVRCDFYAATLGSKDSCFRTARHAIELAQRTAPSDVCNRFFEAATGWLAVADDAREVRIRRGEVSHWDDMRVKAERAALVLIRECLAYHAAANGEEVPEEPVVRKVIRGRGRMVDDARPRDVDCDLAEILESAVDPKASGVVAIHEIGNPGTHEGKKIAEAYKPVAGVRLPLPPVPDLILVRRNLVAEFPHAEAVIDSILHDLGGRDHVRLKPTIFVGRPGCGKTTMAMRLLTELGIGHQIYACGGVSDSSLAGTARQWSTGTPSLPVSLVARYRTAAPGVILDEISRAATGHHNGSLVDALLSMLEPASACRHLDPYLQTECDLSAVIWLGTCNDLKNLPTPLKDRCRVISFPSPGLDHMPTLANALLRRAVEDLGLSAAWATGLDGVELEALAGTWTNGSLRGLRKLVEAVLDARNHGMARA